MSLPALQLDDHFGELTVRQTLDFAARCHGGWQGLCALLHAFKACPVIRVLLRMLPAACAISKRTPPCAMCVFCLSVWQHPSGPANLLLLAVTAMCDVCCAELLELVEAKEKELGITPDADVKS